MNRALIAMAVLALVPWAVADEDEGSQWDGNYADAVGDASAGLDILDASWMAHESLVQVTLDSALADGAGLTVILFVGEAGAAEPAAAFVMHTGPGGDQFMDASGSIEGSAQLANNTVTFTADSHAEGGCSFAVARTVTYPVEGQQVHDVVGWSDDHIGAAWNNGRACSEGQPVDAVHNIGAVSHDAPGWGMALSGLVLALAAMVWRRP